MKKKTLLLRLETSTCALRSGVVLARIVTFLSLFLCITFVINEDCMSKYVDGYSGTANGGIFMMRF